MARYRMVGCGSLLRDESLGSTSTIAAARGLRLTRIDSRKGATRLSSAF